MRAGGLPLAGVLVLAWGLVYVVTQQLVDPPLGVGTTMIAGVTLTILLTLGYPSALRGPRVMRRRPARLGDSSGSNRTIAAVGRSMPLRSGLTADAAQRTAQLLRPLLSGDAVAITDQERVLAFVGPGADHHTVGDPPQTETSARVLTSGKTVVVRHRDKQAARRTAARCSRPWSHRW